MQALDIAHRLKINYVLYLILKNVLVFFRALKFVFSKSIDTKGQIGLSVIYSMSYTILYLRWIFAIVYITTILN